MSDYTPSTDEVRGIYNERVGNDIEFDDWLAAHDRKVKAAALESLAQEMHDWAFFQAGPDGAHFARVWEKRIRDRAEATESEAP